MRLTTIKLSGFKSFAEPVQVQLPGQRIAVVGPNGCGKSNIMDAVRWVLGESRASELRGESMQDVIFSGTDARKPASRASVELVFDNSEHPVGGQWSQYAEIAVKRVLTRDGGSSYMINGQVVRRRDVHDLFLGTGLGPRAYAIIGQGTISRIIESRPEEMRLFLEEAAGVSKYKDRRRETANRLQDTHENLTRVEDILRELRSQINRLERQAEVAQKYNQLKELATKRQHQQWWLKLQAAQAEQQQLSLKISQAQTTLEERVSELFKIESLLESARQEHYAAGDAVNQAQGKLYETDAAVGKLETEIKFIVDGRNRSKQRIGELSAQIQSWKEREAFSLEELESVAGQQLTAEEEVTILSAQLEEGGLNIPELEASFHKRQQEASMQREQIRQLEQQVQLLEAEQRMMVDQAKLLEARGERLSAEKSQQIAPDQQALETLEGQMLEEVERQGVLEAQIETLSHDVVSLSEKNTDQQQQLQKERALQTGLLAHLEALKALQEKVQVDGLLQPWLKDKGFDSLVPLWQSISVEAGWENAVESVLREKIAALQITDLQQLESIWDEAPPKRQTFYTSDTSTLKNHQPDPLKEKAGAKPLLQMVKTHHIELRALLADWLDGCWAVESLSKAVQQRDQLQVGEVYYVPQGHSVSAFSLSFYAPDSEQAGMLGRQQEIENLEKQIKAQALMVEQAEQALAKQESELQRASITQEEKRKEAVEVQRSIHNLEVKILQLKQQQQNYLQRSSQLEQEHSEVTAQLLKLEEDRAVTAERIAELKESLVGLQELQVGLDERVEAGQREMALGREQHRALETRLQEANFSLRTLKTRENELKHANTTATQQVKMLLAETSQLEVDLGQMDEASSKSGLQEMLEVKATCEKELSQARQLYEALAQKLRAYDEQRMQINQKLEPLRKQVTDLQLKSQAVEISVEQFSTHLEEEQVELEALAQSVEEEQISLEPLQDEIDHLKREIATLGAVNLAAFDELNEASERQKFLDAQVHDLNQAISTLESAIIKIDVQTRDLLTNTYNQVNHYFGEMFPELFGGGHAKLVMTGDDVLSSGIQVMAQPPGKRNSTIYLLSGGEKALTAIALVFAIFRLNPAPFCLLDEVDAPLDDANTERYTQLVSRMSKGTQFLFISHNKIAMEMAEQLIGVTMQEQGVSRIVAVDMQEAMEMAGAL